MQVYLWMDFQKLAVRGDLERVSFGGRLLIHLALRPSHWIEASLTKLTAMHGEPCTMCGRELQACLYSLRVFELLQGKTCFIFTFLPQVSSTVFRGGAEGTKRPKNEVEKLMMPVVGFIRGMQIQKQCLG